MKTSDFLKDKMRELRITQNEVGRRCDISQGTVHNILNGGSIREDTLIKIACAFNCPLSSFDEWKGHEAVNTFEPSSQTTTPMSEAKQKLLDLFDNSKAAQIMLTQMLQMTEDQILDQVLHMQESIRKGR